MAQRVTLIPGDGIGPELADATRRVLDGSGVEFEWEVVEAGEAMIAEHGTPLPENVLESISRNRVAIKGPITTPVGEGFRSVNVALRQTLGLYANLRPARSIEGLKTRFDDVDLVIVRENTEDLYAGIEHRVGRDAAESIKIITREASERIGPEVRRPEQGQPDGADPERRSDASPSRRAGSRGAGRRRAPVGDRRRPTHHI